MKDLVKIIRNNPGCVAIIDNDHWTLCKEHPDTNPHDGHESGDSDADIDAADKWLEENELARAGDDIVELGDGGYGSGNCYGGDILQALAIIVGIKIESV